MTETGQPHSHTTKPSGEDQQGSARDHPHRGDGTWQSQDAASHDGVGKVEDPWIRFEEDP